MFTPTKFGYLRVYICVKESHNEQNKDTQELLFKSMTLTPILIFHEENVTENTDVVNIQIRTSKIFILNSERTDGAVLLLGYQFPGISNNAATQL